MVNTLQKDNVRLSAESEGVGWEAEGGAKFAGPVGGANGWSTDCEGGIGKHMKVNWRKDAMQIISAGCGEREGNAGWEWNAVACDCEAFDGWAKCRSGWMICGWWIDCVEREDHRVGEGTRERRRLLWGVEWRLDEYCGTQVEPGGGGVMEWWVVVTERREQEEGRDDCGGDEGCWSVEWFGRRVGWEDEVYCRRVCMNVIVGGALSLAGDAKYADCERRIRVWWNR